MADKQAAPGKGAAPTMQELLEMMLCPPNTPSCGSYQAHATVLDVLIGHTITLRVSRVSGRVGQFAAPPKTRNPPVHTDEVNDDRTGLYSTLERATGKAIAA